MITLIVKNEGNEYRVEAEGYSFLQAVINLLSKLQEDHWDDPQLYEGIWKMSLSHESWTSIGDMDTQFTIELYQNDD